MCQFWNSLCYTGKTPSLPTCHLLLQHLQVQLLRHFSPSLVQIYTQHPPISCVDQLSVGSQTSSRLTPVSKSIIIKHRVTHENCISHYQGRGAMHHNQLISYISYAEEFMFMGRCVSSCNLNYCLQVMKALLYD